MTKKKTGCKTLDELELSFNSPKSGLSDLCNFNQMNKESGSSETKHSNLSKSFLMKYGPIIKSQGGDVNGFINDIKIMQDKSADNIDQDPISILEQIQSDYNKEIIEQDNLNNSRITDPKSVTINDSTMEESIASIDNLINERLDANNEIKTDGIFFTGYIKGGTAKEMFTIVLNDTKYNMNTSEIKQFSKLINDKKVLLCRNKNDKDKSLKLELLVNNCNFEEIYKICLWLRKCNFIDENMSNSTMLKYLEYQKHYKDTCNLNEILKEYSELDLGVKTVFDNIMLKFFKMIEPEEYKSKIMTEDPKNIIKQIYDYHDSADNAVNSLTDKIFAMSMQTSKLGISREFLPVNLNQLLNRAETHFKSILRLSSLKHLNDRLSTIKDKDGCLKLLYKEGNSLFHNYNGKQSCVTELKELMTQIENTSVEAGNNLIAHKIKKTVETLISSLYKK